VRQFQADRGLDVDGMVGPKTHAELENPVPATGGA
jgi:peptidoglycan hydrolase-like protein with peptidoglycan-binding domain